MELHSCDTVQFFQNGGKIMEFHFFFLIGSSVIYNIWNCLKKYSTQNIRIGQNVPFWEQQDGDNSDFFQGFFKVFSSSYIIWLFPSLNPKMKVISKSKLY